LPIDEAGDYLNNIGYQEFRRNDPDAVALAAYGRALKFVVV
jgi:hypothetical protein